MTPKQIRLTYFLLNKVGLSDMLAELVLIHTNGRTMELKDMQYREAHSLISALQGKANPDAAARSRMIAKIFSLAHEMHWELPNGDVDIARIDAFCKTRTAQKKLLSQFNTDELPGLVTVLETVNFSFLKGI